MNSLNRFQQCSDKIQKFSLIKLNPVIIKQILEMLSHQIFKISCTHHLKMETATLSACIKTGTIYNKTVHLWYLWYMLLVFVIFAPSFCDICSEFFRRLTFSPRWCLTPPENWSGLRKIGNLKNVITPDTKQTHKAQVDAIAHLSFGSN